jgi:hypothetical protein
MITKEKINADLAIYGGGTFNENASVTYDKLISAYKRLSLTDSEIRELNDLYEKVERDKRRLAFSTRQLEAFMCENGFSSVGQINFRLNMFRKKKVIRQVLIEKIHEGGNTVK